jgi:DNA-directed RNA polymerase specialized sigma24 family protein
METEQGRAAIQELPIPFREIILLRVYEELWYQEIAGSLDFPVGTAIHVWGERALLSATMERSDSPSLRGANEKL